MIFHDFYSFSRISGEEFYSIVIPWLSRISMTRVNPVQNINRHEKEQLANEKQKTANILEWNPVFQ